MLDAGEEMEVDTTGDAALAGASHSIASEAPPVDKSLAVSSPRREVTAPGKTDAGERALEEADTKYVVPPITITEEERNAMDDAADLSFLKSMENSFKEMRQRYKRHCKKLQHRVDHLEKAEGEFMPKVNEAKLWHAEKFEDIRSHEAQLAASKEAFVLEQAAAEMAQAEAAKKAEETNGELVQHKIHLDAHEEELAAREEKLAATLRAKDEEIQALLAKHTEELERKQGEALQAQALEHAEKLKEATDAADATGVAKANLESRVR